uniref:Alcohol dehydrogenase-like C-terminal domain-containing protein n=1 Tax=Leersia perrieri TaxID=77586 RepID=A0A0D9X6G7_9ORYZ
MGTMDGIINTVSANIAIAPLMGLLKPNGKIILTLAGSCIGGMADTQEMMDLAAKHGVTADIEVIGADYVNDGDAMERLAKADVRYRFVIDIGNTLKQEAATD